MRNKLLQVEKNKWINISERTDRIQILYHIKKLIEQGEPFRLKDDENKFMLLSSDLFDLSSEPGYEIKKRKLSGDRYAEDLYFEGKLIAIR